MINRKIVIVEDEAISALSVKMQLQSWGYSVIATYSHAEDFIENLDYDTPDLILMDIFLAGNMTGIEAVKKLNEKTAIPVIYITASEDSDTISRIHGTDYSDYIIKPYSFDLLKAKLEKVLSCPS